MSTDQSAIALGRADGLEYREETSLLWRVPVGLVKFARRKPLGAFGALLVFILCAMAAGGGGLSQVGIALPSFYESVFDKLGLPHYGYNEYTLGKHKLEGPSWQHWLGTDQAFRCF
jgi:hypothetical protein